LAFLLAAVVPLLPQSSHSGSASAARPLPADVTHDTYALYSYIYRNSNWVNSDELIGVVRDIAPFPSDPSTRGCLRPQTGDERKMVENAIRLSKDQYAWDAQFDFGRPYKLLSKAEAAEAMECIGRVQGDQSKCKPYTAMRYVRYLSAPGFNHDHTRALVYISQVCGGLCGNSGVPCTEGLVNGGNGKTEASQVVYGLLTDWVAPMRKQ
jgi:hypothetical protein